MECSERGSVAHAASVEYGCEEPYSIPEPATRRSTDNVNTSCIGSQPQHTSMSEDAATNEVDTNLPPQFFAQSQSGSARAMNEDDREMGYDGERVRLLVGSFNVGNSPLEELAPWLPHGGRGYDLIVVGLQESTYRAPKGMRESPLQRSYSLSPNNSPFPLRGISPRWAAMQLGDIDDTPPPGFELSPVVGRPSPPPPPGRSQSQLGDAAQARRGSTGSEGLASGSRGSVIGGSRRAVSDTFFAPSRSFTSPPQGEARDNAASTLASPPEEVSPSVLPFPLSPCATPNARATFKDGGGSSGSDNADEGRLGGGSGSTNGEEPPSISCSASMHEAKKALDLSPESVANGGCMTPEMTTPPGNSAVPSTSEPGFCPRGQAASDPIITRGTRTSLWPSLSPGTLTSAAAAARASGTPPLAGLSATGPSALPRDKSYWELRSASEGMPQPPLASTSPPLGKGLGIERLSSGGRDSSGAGAAKDLSRLTRVGKAVKKRTKELDAGAAHLRSKLRGHLGPDFEQVISLRRMQMRVKVFLRRSLLDDYCEDEGESAAENTGIGKVVANKGGLVCKLRLRGTTLCFVSCHLQAHEGQIHLARRNASCAEILQGARLGNRRAVDIDCQFHHVFWFGDMNYRVTFGLPPEEQHAKVVDLVKERAWSRLWEGDELLRELRARRVLAGFETKPPDFAPTFKTCRGQREGYSIKRIPSYTDRILWKSLPGHAPNLEVLSFVSFPEITSSDHKPVHAAFNVKLTPEIVAPSLDKSKRGRRRARIPAVLDVPRVVHSPVTRLIFHSLQASDLPSPAGGGLRNLYVIFSTDPKHLLKVSSGKVIKTETSKRTLHPRWHSKSCQLTVKDPMLLRHCHVSLLVMDRQRGSKDDFLGVANLSLADMWVNTTAQPPNVSQPAFAPRRRSLPSMRRCSAQSPSSLHAARWSPLKSGPSGPSPSCLHLARWSPLKSSTHFVMDVDGHGKGDPPWRDSDPSEGAARVDEGKEEVARGRASEDGSERCGLRGRRQPMLVRHKSDGSLPWRLIQRTSSASSREGLGERESDLAEDESRRGAESDLGVRRADHPGAARTSPLLGVRFGREGSSEYESAPSTGETKQCPRSSGVYRGHRMSSFFQGKHLDDAAVAQHAEMHAFDLELVKNGIPQGRIRGSCMLKLVRATGGVHFRRGHIARHGASAGNAAAGTIYDGIGGFPAPSRDMRGKGKKRRLKRFLPMFRSAQWPDTSQHGSIDASGRGRDMSVGSRQCTPGARSQPIGIASSDSGRRDMERVAAAARATRRAHRRGGSETCTCM